MGRTLTLALFAALAVGCSAGMAPLPSPAPVDDAAAVDEIVALHRFFEAWFRGERPDDDDGFAPLPAALAPDFVLVSPGGTTMDRPATLAGVRGAHGTWNADDAIWIEDARVVRRTPETVVAHYHEWQRRGGAVRGRISTVVFDASLTWQRVHETWLPDDAAPMRSPGG